MVKKNNTYLKDIADTVGGDADGVHTDNYYLKQISENITGGGGGGDITVDNELSTTSKNPVQNKVITNALNSKADTSNIPSKISDLTDDSDFVESSELSTVATTGDYDDLNNKPSIPIPNDLDGLIMMDNIIGSAGSIESYAKADHVHPSDSSKVNSADLGTLELVITYQDSTTETVNVTKWE